MFKNIIKLLGLTSRTYGSDMEQFIVSKKPTSVAEVEYWSRWYDAHGALRGL